MKNWLLILAGLVGSLSAYADQTNLLISVRQVTHQKPDPYAFSGVGLFSIFRGEQPFAGASCPDISNQEGRLECSIACDKADSSTKPLRVVPPSKSYRVRGYITPASADVQLKGCLLLPNASSTFVYKDSQLVIQQVLKNNPELQQIIKPSPNQETFNFAAINAAMPVMKQVAEREYGGVALISLSQAASALAEKRQEGDPVGAELLSKYQVGINNVLLGEVFKKKSGFGLPTSFKVTADKSDYYGNLLLFEQTLDGAVGRTAQQTILLNDIQALKRQSIDPNRNVKLYRHIPGIRMQDVGAAK